MQPIHYAAQGGHMAVIDELVCFCGVDPNALVSYVITYLCMYIHTYIHTYIQYICYVYNNTLGVKSARPIRSNIANR